MQCAVYSPCGRFHVQFRCERDSKEATVLVRSVSEVGLEYSVVLNEALVQEISMQAGVAKDFRSFTDLLYAALLGQRQETVKFFIETFNEMKDRIMGGGLLQSNADEQNFLTIDYRVEFLQAIFPIPLAKGPHVKVTMKDSDVSNLQKRVFELEDENRRLRRENEELVSLTKKKMNHMQVECDEVRRRILRDQESLLSQKADIRKLSKELASALREISSLKAKQGIHTARRVSPSRADLERSTSSAASNRSQHRRKNSRDDNRAAASRERSESRSSSRGKDPVRRSRFDTPPRSRTPVSGPQHDRRLTSPRSRFDSPNGSKPPFR